MPEPNYEAVVNRWLEPLEKLTGVKFNREYWLDRSGFTNESSLVDYFLKIIDRRCERKLEINEQLQQEQTTCQ